MNKPTWIFSCGTYRTASTTHYTMTQDILKVTNTGIPIGYHQEQKLKKFDVPSPHRYVLCKVFEFLPAGFKGHKDKVGRSVGELIHRERRLKAFATIRDPRDIIVSMRERHRRLMEDPKHQSKPFDFRHRVEVEFPVWLGQLHKWINLGPTITQMSRYEVWTNGLLKEVYRIAEHLEVELTREQARKIAGDHTPKAIVDRKKAKRREGKREDPWLPSIPGILFGTSGAHEDHLTKKEEDMLIKSNRTWMKRYGYL